jgi:hypothetical protein
MADAYRPPTKRALGNSIFCALLLLSILLVIATPFLALGFAVIGLADEQLGNQPGYVLLLIFVRPHLCVAFLWSLFVLAIRREWLTFGARSRLAE